MQRAREDGFCNFRDGYYADLHLNGVLSLIKKKNVDFQYDSDFPKKARRRHIEGRHFPIFILLENRRLRITVRLR